MQAFWGSGRKPKAGQKAGPARGESRKPGQKAGPARGESRKPGRKPSRPEAKAESRAESRAGQKVTGPTRMPPSMAWHMPSPCSSRAYVAATPPSQSTPRAVVPRSHYEQVAHRINRSQLVSLAIPEEVLAAAREVVSGEVDPAADEVVAKPECLRPNRPPPCGSAGWACCISQAR